jgi:hypothetical protein
MRNRFLVVFLWNLKKRPPLYPLLVEEGIQGWWNNNAKSYSTLIFS